jgi:hypothetical protein
MAWRWSSWMSLGGELNGDPAAVLAENGRLVAFWRGRDDALWHRWQEPDFSWTAPPMSLGGELNGDPAAVLAQSGRLVAFWRGRDNALWHRWQEPDFSWTAPPMSLGTDLNGDPAAVLAENGRLAAFWRGPEGTLVSQEQRADFSWDNPSGRFAPLWSQPGGRELNGDPAVTRAENGALVPFLRGADDALWHSWQEPLPDPPPEGVGGGVQTGPDDPPPPPTPLSTFALTLFEDKSTPQKGDFAFNVPPSPLLAGTTITGVRNLTVDKSQTMLPIMLTHPNGTGPARINPNQTSAAFNGLGVPGRWTGFFPIGTFIVGTDEELRIRAHVTLM